MAHTMALESTAPIRVLAVDSTRMNSQLLVEALAKHEGFVVFRAAPEPSHVLAAVRSQQPHVLVLSANLQNTERQGLKLTKSIRTHAPAVQVVILLDAPERNKVVEAFRSGASGVFSRSGSVESLAKCIQKVHAGQVWANSTELRFLLDALCEPGSVRTQSTLNIAGLSKREQDVVRCVADGMTNRQVADHLKLTEHTIKNYLFRIFDKLGVSSRVELVLSAYNMERSFSFPGPALVSSSEKRARSSVPA